MFLSYFRAALRLFPGCCFDYIMIFAKRKECFFVILHLCTISTKQCWFIRVFIAQKRHLYSKTQQKSCTRKEHESATNSIAKRGQGAIAPCRVKGQRPLWGLGQRPNSSTSDQYAKRAQQRCRQRSVPASNSALPQERPRAALPLRFREEPQKSRANRSPSGLIRPAILFHSQSRYYTISKFAAQADDAVESGNSITRTDSP